MIHVIRTSDHPEANGRVALPGEYSWTLTFPHENGDDYIEIHMGKKGHDAIQTMLAAEQAEQKKGG